MIHNSCRETFSCLIFKQKNFLHMHPHTTEPPHTESKTHILASNKWGPPPPPQRISSD